MRHVGLESHRLRAVHRFQQLRPCTSSCACRPSRFRLRPPAVRRSSSATSQASRKVAAIFFVLPAGSFAQSAGPAAESMRTTPYLRTPSSSQLLRDRAGFSPASRKPCVLRRSPWPIRHPSAATPAPPAIHRQVLRFCTVLGQLLQFVIGRIDTRCAAAKGTDRRRRSGRHPPRFSPSDPASSPDR